MLPSLLPFSGGHLRRPHFQSTVHGLSAIMASLWLKSFLFACTSDLSFCATRKFGPGCALRSSLPCPDLLGIPIHLWWSRTFLLHAFLKYLATLHAAYGLRRNYCATLGTSTLAFGSFTAHEILLSVTGRHGNKTTLPACCFLTTSSC